MNLCKKTKTNFAMGVCGKNLAWMLDNGVLTIAGEGEIECRDEVPWKSVFNFITSVVMEDGVTCIGNYAFYRCANLTSVTIPDSVTRIDVGTFRHCAGLTCVAIPDSVTSIGNYAFAYCTGLTSVTIGSGVTRVGWGSFLKCSSLTRIVIPDSVRAFDYCAFSDCHRLTDVYYAGSKTDWGTVKICFGNDALKNATVHYGK